MKYDVRKAIREQEQRIAADKLAWRNLQHLAGSDLPQFFQVYADYLKANHAISDRRKLLIEVFERTAAILASVTLIERPTP